MTPRAPVSMFPPLSPGMAQHSQRVARRVEQAIEAGGGWLAFDEYLQIVQYGAGLGYYSAGSEKFGSAGDFITAPELSSLFGRCVARQCAQILEHAGGDILELGAGTGALAASVLKALQEIERLPRHYFILEVSADLRARQQQRLAGLPPELSQRVSWLNEMPASPIDGVMVANEVTDALPFKRFAVHSGSLFERGISLSESRQPLLADRPAGPSFRAEIERVVADADIDDEYEYESELCPMMEPWIASLSHGLQRGALLLIDYGCSRRDYYHPQRTRGTLRCHFRHRAHDDALLYPGLQDISAWVDFTRVAEGASAANLEVAGYCTQTAFLLANGVEQDLAHVTEPLEHAKLAAQARVLLLPGEMGENFKVMALTRDFEAPLRGFSLQDLRGSL